MSFAAQVSELTRVCFSDAGLGEAATYTPPGGGTVQNIRAVVDEPNEAPFARDTSRSAYHERQLSLWISLLDADDAVVSPAKGGTVVVSTSHGVVRTFTLVSSPMQDPDREQWNVKEVTA